MKNKKRRLLRLKRRRARVRLTQKRRKRLLSTVWLKERVHGTWHAVIWMDKIYKINKKNMVYIELKRYR